MEKDQNEWRMKRENFFRKWQMVGERKKLNKEI